MNKKQILQLAEVSYVGNRLNENLVNRISERLGGREQRMYLRALRRLESKYNVYIDSSLDLTEQNKKILAELYPKKQVLFRKNTDLLLGIRITEDDMVYNLNMKDSLDQLKIYLDRTL